MKLRIAQAIGYAVVAVIHMAVWQGHPLAWNALLLALSPTEANDLGRFIVHPAATSSSIELSDDGRFEVRGDDGGLVATGTCDPHGVMYGWHPGPSQAVVPRAADQSVCVLWVAPGKTKDDVIASVMWAVFSVARWP